MQVQHLGYVDRCMLLMTMNRSFDAVRDNMRTAHRRITNRPVYQRVLLIILIIVVIFSMIYIAILFRRLNKRIQIMTLYSWLMLAFSGFALYYAV